jgi:hypothetical protein
MKKTPKPKVPVPGDLTLEQTLIGFLDRLGWDGSEIVPALLREHAHELAGKQRKKADQFAILRSEDARLKAEGLRMGADLIDPEKNA